MLHSPKTTVLHFGNVGERPACNSKGWRVTDRPELVTCAKCRKILDKPKKG